MQLAADTTPFRRLCDVNLNPAGAEDFIVRSARASHVECVAAACHSVAPS
jgi:hypothetical protein